MKKKMFLLAALAVTATLALSSCGGGNRDAEPPVSDSPAQVEEETPAPADSTGRDTALVVDAYAEMPDSTGL